MHTLLRTIIGFLALAWLIASLVLYGQTPFNPQFSTTVLAGITGVGLMITAVRGLNKFSALAGKVLIAMSVLTIVTQLINDGFDISNVDMAVRALVLLMGLGLERMSPHQQLYDWMFLMLATKLQFVITAAFIAAAGSARASYFPLSSWWLLPITMIAAVPFLARKKRRVYRPLVLLTTLIALVLSFDFITSQPEISGITLIALSAVIWPAITERLIGYRTFVSRRH